MAPFRGIPHTTSSGGSDSFFKMRVAHSELKVSYEANWQPLSMRSFLNMTASIAAWSMRDFSKRSPLSARMKTCADRIDGHEPVQPVRPKMPLPQKNWFK